MCHGKLILMGSLKVLQQSSRFVVTEHQYTNAESVSAIVTGEDIGVFELAVFWE